jgi:phosphonate degradation associated HDIG domain protein
VAAGGILNRPVLSSTVAASDAAVVNQAADFHPGPKEIAMTITLTDPRLAELAALIDGKAEGRYGLSDINQRQHALQAAWLAEQENAGPALITAALLHDVGHLIHDLGEDPAKDGIDDQHEIHGHDWLVHRFGPDVTEPVRLHVAAKRYLCATDPGYFGKLSSDSVLSLSLQGGPMSAAEVAAFEALAEHAAAVRLRRWDEAAKVKDLATPGFAHFAPAIAACLR